MFVLDWPIEWLCSVLLHTWEHNHYELYKCTASHPLWFYGVGFTSRYEYIIFNLQYFSIQIWPDNLITDSIMDSNIHLSFGNNSNWSLHQNWAVIVISYFCMSPTNLFDLTKFFYEFMRALQTTGRIRMAKFVIHFMRLFNCGSFWYFCGREGEKMRTTAPQTPELSLMRLTMKSIQMKRALWLCMEMIIFQIIDNISGTTGLGNCRTQTVL